MGRKVNPIGFRLPVRRDWKSRWYAKGRHFTDLVIQDARARRMIEKEYTAAMISRIEIEQKIDNAHLIIHAARPGVLIGKKGEGIEKLRLKLKNIFSGSELQVDIKEIAQPETDAKVVALNIANQLENRVMFRRAMRRALANAMRLKVEGIKIMSSGRLNGIEIARTEWYREGRVPLHTLKNDVDYGFAEANTPMGVVGVKVWISKGDLHGVNKKAKYTFGDDAPAAEVPPVIEEVKATENTEEAAVGAKTVITKPAVKKSIAQTADEEESASVLAKKKPAAKKAAKKPAAKKPAAKKAAKKPAVKKAAKKTTADDGEKE